MSINVKANRPWGAESVLALISIQHDAILLVCYKESFCMSSLLRRSTTRDGRRSFLEMQNSPLMQSTTKTNAIILTISTKAIMKLSPWRALRRRVSVMSAGQGTPSASCARGGRVPPWLPEPSWVDCILWGHGAHERGQAPGVSEC